MTNPTKRSAQKEAADKSAAQKLDTATMEWAKSGAKSPDDFPEVERASARTQKPTGPARKDH